jgi:hypothetical protein
VLELKLVSPP